MFTRLVINWDIVTEIKSSIWIDNVAACDGDRLCPGRPDDEKYGYWLDIWRTFTEHLLYASANIFHGSISCLYDQLAIVGLIY